MRTFVAETMIDRSAQEIWAYAADIARHTEWMSVSEARVLSGQGTERGARGIERLELGPIKRDLELEVADAVPDRRLLWRSVPGGDLHMEVELTLEPAEGGGTLARYKGSYELRGRLRLLAPIMALEGRSGIKRELGLLKAKVEAQAVAGMAASGSKG